MQPKLESGLEQSEAGGSLAGSASAAGHCLTQVEQGLIEHALSVLKGISRTFKGVSDTSTSPDKLKLNVEGAELAQRVEENFRSTLTFLLVHSPLPLSAPADVKNLIETVTRRLNEGLVRPEQGFWRTWSTGVAAHPPPEAIPTAMDGFYAEFLERYSATPRDGLAFAAWIEKRFNGEIHPLADGCGRCSRLLAAFVLAEAGLALPEYRDRGAFFRKINEPLESWVDYYRSMARP